MNRLKPVILLTGEPGIGKSTVIKHISDLASNISAGFYTREVSKNKKRIGFEIVTLDKESALLATKEHHIEFVNQVVFGDYRINLDAMEKVAVPTLKKAISNGKIIIIDEIGPMEIFSKSFCQTLIKILDDNTITVVGTIVKRSYEFADWVRKHPRVTTIEVSLKNRDNLASEIYSEIVEH
jgi:nucleoside-triphosphatase THEP1